MRTDTAGPRGRGLVLAVLAVAAAAPAITRAGTTVLRGGTIVDVADFGRRGADVTDAVVVIEGPRIAYAGPAAGAPPVPRGARVIDARGTYLVPGLIDGFGIVDDQGYANAYLGAGVTSILALGGDPGKDARRGPLFRGASPGPRLFELRGLEGYPDEAVRAAKTMPELLRSAAPLDEAGVRAQVRARAQPGVRALLVLHPVRPEQLPAIVDEARKHGLALLGELGFTPYADAVAAGVQAFVHTSRYVADLLPHHVRVRLAARPFPSAGSPESERLTELLRTLDTSGGSFQEYATRFAGAKVALMPTAALAYARLPGHRNVWDDPAARAVDPARVTHQPVNPATGLADGQPRPVPDDRPFHERRVDAAFAKAGARFLAGSGADAFGVLPGVGLHVELEQLVYIGLTPREALAAATWNHAEILGWNDVGALEAGRRADLVVLEADPTLRIENLRRIRTVYLDGKPLDPARLLAPRAR